MDEREAYCIIFASRCNKYNIVYVIPIGTPVITKVGKRRKNCNFRKINIEKIYEPANV